MGVCIPVCRGQHEWERRDAVWAQRDKPRIWGSIQVVGDRRTGCQAGPSTPEEQMVWLEGKRLRPEKESRRGWLLAPAYSLHLCPQVLLQEQGWQRLEELRDQQHSQALVNLHHSFHTCISRQRVLPRMQARMRGFQARSASIGARAEVGVVRPWAHPPGGGARLGKHSASGQVILPHRHVTVLDGIPPIPMQPLLEYPSHEKLITC